MIGWVLGVGTVVRMLDRGRDVGLMVVERDVRGALVA